MRFIGLFAALCASAVALDFDGDILNQLHTVEKLSAEQPATIRIDALMRAATLARGTHPEEAARLADRAIADIQWSRIIPSPAIISSLEILRPHSAESIALSVGDSGVAYTSLALEKMRTRDGPGGAELIRRALKEGNPAPFAAMPLLRQLARSNPKLASALMQDIVNAFPWQKATAGQLRWMLNCANSMIPADNKVAAATAARVLQSLKAGEPTFRTGVKMCAAYAIGDRFVRTANTRDTLLFPAGVYLRAYGSDAFEQEKELFAKWSDVLDDLTPAQAAVAGFAVRFTVETASSPVSAEPPPQYNKMTVAEVMAAVEKNEPPAASVQVLIDQMRSRELSGADCAQITTRAVPIIDGLHSRAERLSAAESLLYTLLDLSAPAEARQSAAAALARAAAESAGKEREVATEYADRGEAGLTYVPADALSAIAFNVPDMTAPSPLSTGLRLYYELKSLANLTNQRIDFELSGLDGKTYRLSDYKGKIILLNFWATWCPPCRVEMPTLERLHRDLSSKDLVLLAVSDEDSATVSGFAKKHGYTLPFLLDPDDRVRDRYGRRGIPQTIIISREGKIIEQFYGVREESEYLATLRRAGLN